MQILNCVVNLQVFWEEVVGGAFPKWETAIFGRTWEIRSLRSNDLRYVGPDRQNPSLFCTNSRKDSAPREFQSCFKRTTAPRGRVGHPPVRTLKNFWKVGVVHS